MKFKDGIITAGLHEKMRQVMVNADIIWRKAGHELVVTSGLDSCHSPGSLHYCGRALDLRTRYFTDSEVTACATTLRDILGADYDVVNHPHRYDRGGNLLYPGHVHAEYDPKGD
jgi:hypothetical protein